MHKYLHKNIYKKLRISDYDKSNMQSYQNKIIRRPTESQEAIGQLRLLLPKSWIPELDTIAATRFITRLALIRFYLRSMMNSDLEDLEAHFKKREQQQNTCQKARAYLDENDL